MLVPRVIIQRKKTQFLSLGTFQSIRAHRPSSEWSVADVRSEAKTRRPGSTVEEHLCTAGAMGRLLIGDDVLGSEGISQGIASGRNCKVKDRKGSGKGCETSVEEILGAQYC